MKSKNRSNIKFLALPAFLGFFISPFLVNKFAFQGKIAKVITYKIFSIKPKLVQKKYSKDIIQVDSYNRFDHGEIEKEKINLNNYDTAFVIMDPWDNHSIEEVNEEIKFITKTKILPLVKSLRNKNYPVIVVTNKCKKGINSSCGIDNSLDEIEGIKTYYHNYETSRSFGIKLRKEGINNLVYAGYSSNGCVLGARKMSIIPMYHEGFSIGFIPEASSAIEIKETSKIKTLHKSTVSIISQWAGSILDYKSILNSLE